jgi:Flp pilus assembly protein TadG
MRVPARGNDVGAAAVEFALVSVLLFTVFFGIIQYGYFFLQSSGAEHAALVGARAAAVGIDNCATWKQLVEDSGSSADVQSASAVRDPTSGPMVRGDAIKVTVIWTPLDLGLPFIPFPGADQHETALARVERLGTVTTGCP